MKLAAIVAGDRIVFTAKPGSLHAEMEITYSKGINRLIESNHANRVWSVHN